MSQQNQSDSNEFPKILELDFYKNVVLCVNEFFNLLFSLGMKYRKTDIKSFARLKTHIFDMQNTRSNTTNKHHIQYKCPNRPCGVTLFFV
mgnify:CR=1 FL=1